MEINQRYNVLGSSKTTKWLANWRHTTKDSLTIFRYNTLPNGRKNWVMEESRIGEGAGLFSRGEIRLVLNEPDERYTYLSTVKRTVIGEPQN